MVLAQRAYDNVAEEPAASVRAEAGYLLAQVLASRAGDARRALALARQAMKDYAQAGDRYAGKRAEVEAWLAARQQPVE